jgi:hypothetical protein
MKFRLIALIVFVSIVLVSCSLSEDITPPPGYRSPRSGPTSTLMSATQTPEATWTPEPATATIASTMAGIQSGTPVVMTTAHPAALGIISGKVINGSGGIIPDGQKVTLIGFDPDQSGSYQKTMEVDRPVNPDGSYGFTDVQIILNRAFLVVTSSGGVEYQSNPLIVKDTTTNYTIPITIYDKTSDYKVLTINQVHLEFDLSSQDVINVSELFIVTNPGKQVVAITSDGTTIPFLQIPTGANSVKFQLSQGSAQLLNATGGFALPPGVDKQYGFIATFSMPFSSSLKFDQPFLLPVSSMTVFIPQGMRLSGEQLASAGTQTIQNQPYLMYQTNNLASGSSLSLKLSGKPGNSTGFKFDRQTLTLLGIGIVGILLIIVGIYLYVRDRARFVRENSLPEGVIEEDALGENRDNLMDAMIALDDQYKAGEIPKEAYETRRTDLKERLKGSL